jgi:hypothetical protein
MNRQKPGKTVGAFRRSGEYTRISVRVLNIFKKNDEGWQMTNAALLIGSFSTSGCHRKRDLSDYLAL